MFIREVHQGDEAAWIGLRKQLWPNASLQEHQQEVNAYFATRGHRPLTLVLEDERGQLVGLLEASLHTNAEGCETSPVGYIEGWYVQQDCRRQGWGRRLMETAEAWARELGLREMASDCARDNSLSELVHKRLGYQETSRMVSFKKKL